MTKKFIRRSAVVTDTDNKRASFVDTFNQTIIHGQTSGEDLREGVDASESFGVINSENGDDDDDDDDDDDLSFVHGEKPEARQHKNSASESTASSNKLDDDLKRERLISQRWRMSVRCTLLVAMSVVLIGVWFLLRQQHEAVHLQTYNLVTQSMHKVLHEQFFQFRHAVTTLSWTISSSAVDDDSVTATPSFPLVRVPQFELAASPLVHTASVITTWNPLVAPRDNEAWSDFVQAENGWYAESVTTYQAAALLDGATLSSDTLVAANQSMSIAIWDTDPNIASSGSSSSVEGPQFFAPIWQCSPPPVEPWSVINYNVLSDPVVSTTLWPSLTKTLDGVTSAAQTTVHPVWSRLLRSNDMTKVSFPYSYHLEPVFTRIHDRASPLVGFVTSIVAWDNVMTHLVTTIGSGVGSDGIVAVVKNTCDQHFTFELNSDKSTFLGIGDLHDTSYDSTETSVQLATYAHNESKVIDGHCLYSISLYSSNKFKASMETDNFVLLCLMIIVGAFAVLAFVFGLYDRFLRRRNLQFVTEAARSNAIISSLFPTQFRARLFAEKANVVHPTAPGPVPTTAASKTKLQTVLNSGSYVEAHATDAQDLMYDSKPIADLFPETTILFADIAGFTAWSSVREPSQVFILLETLYRAFDSIAKRRRVFKVETIGDCYVAVTGLPDPRKDHAVAMARFSRDCMIRMRSLCKQLEVTLGPDTGDLAMRMGMHSGPVTAGVLRGERSRFQLFGDTMNTAARMEHTGIRDKIQVSQETADQLIAAGKTNWLTKREDVVIAKGKGEMHTYWLEVRGSASSVIDPTEQDGNTLANAGEVSVATTLKFDSKTTRLIEWNVDVLMRSLKQIIARRKAYPIDPSEYVPPNEARYSVKHGLNTLDEVMEVITLPKFKEANEQDPPENVAFEDAVIHELREFVSQIASKYRDNPFHNFEHASHVSMSVVKLLSRIIAPNQVESEELDVFMYHEDESDQNKKVASMLHDHTYGITSDPLTQFSCVLSALIHDVDHAGVPNAQLVEENAKVAKLYKNKSVAEQNSVDLAWDLLMSDSFKTLRRTIYDTDDELKRFRMLVVNSVMATDIVDKTLKTLRNLRWDRAFSQTTQSADNSVTVNRKATIVIEHLIQASDVAHTMQHWHVYRKWNERFFLECYQAYRDGRASKNPAEGWYEGEIGFFDFYIIPLAKKLKDCGVFGVSSDEYLNYAIRNRQEWETRGRELVNEMIEMVTAKGPDDDNKDF